MLACHPLGVEPSIPRVEKHKQPGQRVPHTLQTNGTRLDNDWGRFFKQHNFLVGLSIDGPQPLHDTYRVDKRNRGTFHQVMQGWQILKRHQVDINIRSDGPNGKSNRGS